MKEKREREDEAEEEAAAAYDETECIRQMVALMQPKETVAKALRRLGGGKKTSAQVPHSDLSIFRNKIDNRLLLENVF